MFTPRTTLKAVTSITAAIAMGTTPVLGWLGEPQSQVTCPTCTGQTSGDTAVTLFDSARTVVRDSVPIALLPVTVTPHDGVPVNYVQSATGHVAFSVADIEFQSELPIVLMRYYNSGQSTVQSGLGAGWSLVLDDQVEVDGSVAKLRSAVGETVDMTLDPQGDAFAPTDPGGTYHQPLRRADNGTLREQAGSATRVYTFDGGVYRLTRVEYGELGNMEVSRDARGKVRRVAASNNSCSIDLTWSSDAQPRLLSATDSTGRSVTYSYDGDKLSGVTDVAGATWRYSYDSTGPLGLVVDPEGSTALHVTYAGAHAKTSESLDGLAQFSYEQKGNVLNPTVTLPQDQVTIVHNEFGQIASVKSKAGASTTLTYDASRRLIAVDGPGALRQRYGYDASDRRTFSDINGQVTRWEYDAAGRITRRYDGAAWITLSYPNSQTVTVSGPIARLNSTSIYESGRLIRSVGAAGEETYAYDALGQVTTYIDRGGQTTFENDAHGWVRRLQLPDGSSVDNTFDARGELTSSRDSSGRRLNYERDRRGALVAVTASDGGWVRATRDQSGRILQLTNSHQQSRAFSYDASGRLATYTNALGQVFGMRYDRQGALMRLEQQGGSRTISKTFRAATPRANAGGQATTANTDADAWYDPDNPQGLLGAFHHIRGAQSAGKGNTSKPAAQPAGVSGPFTPSTDAPDSALVCSGADCATCKANALSSCQSSASDCRRRASLTFYICVIACGAVAPTIIVYLICTAGCATNKVNSMANCQGSFNLCKLTIPGQCASVCK